MIPTGGTLIVDGLGYTVTACDGERLVAEAEVEVNGEPKVQTMHCSSHAPIKLAPMLYGLPGRIEPKAPRANAVAARAAEIRLAD